VLNEPFLGNWDIPGYFQAWTIKIQERAQVSQISMALEGSQIQATQMVNSIAVQIPLNITDECATASLK
jgi:hypothetical protein